MTRIRLGLDQFALNQKKQEIPVFWDSNRAINAHMLVAGDSGTGKSYTLRKIANELSHAGKNVRVHVFDVHGDIDIDNASTVKFSETTDYGFNPLRVNPHRDFGGVRKTIQSFIAGMNSTSRKLGSKQEAVLRYLLQDMFESFGFYENDPSSWVIRPEDIKKVTLTGEKANRVYLDIPFAEKDIARDTEKTLAFDQELKCWYVSKEKYNGRLLRWGEKIWGKRNPTLSDAVTFARRKLEAVFVGTNSPGVNRLSEVNSRVSAYNRKINNALRQSGTAEIEDREKLQSELDTAKQKAIDAYCAYLNAISTGREFEEVLRYDSSEVLKSVYERLCNLSSIGIFKSRTPPFDPSKTIWRYDIKALSFEEKLLFVYFHLDHIFNLSIQQGIVPDDDRLRHVIILDEANSFFSDEDDNVINRIAKEGRKFGMAMVCASQSPTHFSSDFLSTVALKIILPIDPLYWDQAARKLNIDRKLLQYLVPRESGLINIKESGKSSSPYRTVYLKG